jgi:hypothetical protein
VKVLARGLVPIALLLAGCQIILFSWPAGEPVPDVLGAWQGVWLQSPPLPMQVVITTQDGTRASGIVTYQRPSGAVSTGIRGEFGIRNGRRVLLMSVAGLDRTDDFEFTTLGPDRLEGMGAGSGLGGQRGPLALRRPATSPGNRSR